MRSQSLRMASRLTSLSIRRMLRRYYLPWHVEDIGKVSGSLSKGMPTRTNRTLAGIRLYIMQHMEDIGKVSGSLSKGMPTRTNRNFACIRLYIMQFRADFWDVS